MSSATLSRNDSNSSSVSKQIYLSLQGLPATYMIESMSMKDKKAFLTYRIIFEKRCFLLTSTLKFSNLALQLTDPSSITIHRVLFHKIPASRYIECPESFFNRYVDIVYENLLGDDDVQKVKKKNTADSNLSTTNNIPGTPKLSSDSDDRDLQFAGDSTIDNDDRTKSQHDSDAESNNDGNNMTENDKHLVQEGTGRADRVFSTFSSLESEPGPDEQSTSPSLKRLRKKVIPINKAADHLLITLCVPDFNDLVSAEDNRKSYTAHFGKRVSKRVYPRIIIHSTGYLHGISPPSSRLKLLLNASYTVSINYMNSVRLNPSTTEDEEDSLSNNNSCNKNNNSNVTKYRKEDCIEITSLCGLALVNAKKYRQGAEMLRRAAKLAKSLFDSYKRTHDEIKNTGNLSSSKQPLSMCWEEPYNGYNSEEEAARSLRTSRSKSITQSHARSRSQSIKSEKISCGCFHMNTWGANLEILAVHAYFQPELWLPETVTSICYIARYCESDIMRKLSNIAAHPDAASVTSYESMLIFLNQKAPSSAFTDIRTVSQAVLPALFPVLAIACCEKGNIPVQTAAAKIIEFLLDQLGAIMARFICTIVRVFIAMLSDIIREENETTPMVTISSYGRSGLKTTCEHILDLCCKYFSYMEFSTLQELLTSVISPLVLDQAPRNMEVINLKLDTMSSPVDPIILAHLYRMLALLLKVLKGDTKLSASLISKVFHSTKIEGAEVSVIKMRKSALAAWEALAEAIILRARNKPPHEFSSYFELAKSLAQENVIITPAREQQTGDTEKSFSKVEYVNFNCFKRAIKLIGNLAISLKPFSDTDGVSSAFVIYELQKILMGMIMNIADATLYVIGQLEGQAQHVPISGSILSAYNLTLSRSGSLLVNSSFATKNVEANIDVLEEMWKSFWSVVKILPPSMSLEALEGITFRSIFLYLQERLTHRSPPALLLKLMVIMVRGVTTDVDVERMLRQPKRLMEASMALLEVLRALLPWAHYTTFDDMLELIDLLENAISPHIGPKDLVNILEAIGHQTSNGARAQKCLENLAELVCHQQPVDFEKAYISLIDFATTCSSQSSGKRITSGIPVIVKSKTRKLVVSKSKTNKYKKSLMNSLKPMAFKHKTSNDVYESEEEDRKLTGYESFYLHVCLTSCFDKFDRLNAKTNQKSRGMSAVPTSLGMQSCIINQEDFVDHADFCILCLNYIRSKQAWEHREYLISQISSFYNVCVAMQDHVDGRVRQCGFDLFIAILKTVFMSTATEEQETTKDPHPEQFPEGNNEDETLLVTQKLIGKAETYITEDRNCDFVLEEKAWNTFCSFISSILEVGKFPDFAVQQNCLETVNNFLTDCICQKASGSRSFSFTNMGQLWDTASKFVSSPWRAIRKLAFCVLCTLVNLAVLMLAHSRPKGTLTVMYHSFSALCKQKIYPFVEKGIQSNTCENRLGSIRIVECFMRIRELNSQIGFKIPLPPRSVQLAISNNSKEWNVQVANLCEEVVGFFRSEASVMDDLNEVVVSEEFKLRMFFPKFEFNHFGTEKEVEVFQKDLENYLAGIEDEEPFYIPDITDVEQITRWDLNSPDDIIVEDVMEDAQWVDSEDFNVESLDLVNEKFPENPVPENEQNDSEKTTHQRLKGNRNTTGVRIIIPDAEDDVTDRYEIQEIDGADDGLDDEDIEDKEDDEDELLEGNDNPDTDSDQDVYIGEEEHETKENSGAEGKEPASSEEDEEDREGTNASDDRDTSDGAETPSEESEVSVVNEIAAQTDDVNIATVDGSKGETSGNSHVEVLEEAKDKIEEESSKAADEGCHDGDEMPKPPKKPELPALFRKKLNYT